MKNKFILPILFFFFLLIIIGYSFTVHSFAMKCWGYVIGDWLIDFQTGFVRRGLCGFLLIKISDFMDVLPNYTVMWVQTGLFISFMSLLFFILSRKKINIWFLLLLISPATLLFPIFDPNAAGRKEIILFFIFAFYIICLNKNLLRSNIVIILFSAALLIATLFHELVFFYTPYFLFAAYLKYKINDQPFRFPRALFVLLGSFLIMIPLYLYGKDLDGTIMCAGLKARGLPDTICLGPLGWPINCDENILLFAMENNYILLYSTTFILGLIPFVLFVKNLKEKIVSLKRFFISVLLLFLFSSPLFYLAVDWGRWINIHFILLLITSTLFLKDRSKEPKTDWSNEKFSIPKIWRSENILLKLSSNIVFFFICFLYVALWSMPHFTVNPQYSAYSNLETIQSLWSLIMNTLSL